MKIVFADLLPGETPIDDTSGLKIPGISTREELSVAEALNIRKVLVKYFGNNPINEIATFDVSWARSLHEDMYCDVWDWAGRFRTRDLNLGCHWPQIQEKIHNLLEDLRFWESNGVDLVEQAARLHHGAVYIHPFENGNGRWSRTLTNIWMALHDSPGVIWPEDLIGSMSPIREQYIEALKAADNGDMGDFVEMHRSYLSSD
jgi:Fic-DOC domain mobile mystery protein B